MIRSVKSFSWRPVAIAIVAGGLAAGGLWVARGQMTLPVQAQETQPAPSGQAPDPAPRKASARPTGVVTAIADEPASFTFRTASGEEQTVRLTERSVTQGRGDRPYSMALLQVGDYVRVKLGGTKQKQPDAAKRVKRAGAARKPEATAVDGTPIARRVIVRPAAEGPFPEGGRPGKGARKSGSSGAGKQNGGLDGGADE
jgi:hypothetical protein